MPPKDQKEEFDFSGLTPAGQPVPSAGDKYDFSGLSPAEKKTILQELPSIQETVLRHGVQGLTGGYGDEIYGALNNYKGGAKALLNMLGQDYSQDPDYLEYKKYRDEDRAANELARKTNPKAALAANIGGGLLTAAIPGLGATSVAKAGLVGAGMAVGGSDAETLGGVAKDAAVGYATGGIGQQLGTVLSKTIAKPVVNSLEGSEKTLQRSAGDQALGAIGISKKAAAKELGDGRGLFVDKDFRKGIGQEALENLGWTNGAEGVYDSAQKSFKEILDQKKPLLSEVRDKFNEHVMQGGKLPQELRTPFDQELKSKIDDSVRYLLDTETDMNKIQAFKEEMYGYVDRVFNDPNRSGNSWDIKRLDEVKQKIGNALSERKFAQNTNDLPVKDDLLRDFYGALKTRIETIADATGDNAGQKLKALNQKEGNLIDLLAVTKNERAKDMAKQFGGVGDWATIGLGTTYGGPLGGFAAIGAKKGIETALGTDTRGAILTGLAKTTAASARAAGRMAQSGVQNASISGLNEGVQNFSDYSKNLYSASNDQLNTVANTLRVNGHTDIADSLDKAISDNDSSKKNAVLFSIMQDPNKRKILHQE
jgi:hypothetical protein